MESPVHLLQSLLQHGPQRNATMCSLAEYERSLKKKKYHDRTGNLSTGQLREHIRGGRTYAVPPAANGLGTWLAIDQDSDASEAIPALMQAATALGVPAIGVIQTDNKGYLHIRTAELVNVDRLRLLGDAIIQCAARSHWQKQPDNRAGNADTRLPLGRHTHTGTHGMLLLPCGEFLNIDANPVAAWQRVCAAWEPVDVSKLPLAPIALPRAPRATRERSGIATLNASLDTEGELRLAGAKKAGRGLYWCPFHDDRTRPSLVVYVDQAGQTACRCMSRNSGCPLAERAIMTRSTCIASGKG